MYYLLLKSLLCNKLCSVTVCILIVYYYTAVVYNSTYHIVGKFGGGKVWRIDSF